MNSTSDNGVREGKIDVARKLTDKQKAFVEAYLKTLNATEAARLAGYNATYESLRRIGSQNLTKPKVREEIDL
ncbi:terminase small subunit, partial [bacterium]|nr:terminase small subunit [bacterium]